LDPGTAAVKILLTFPPQAHPVQPYSSLPCLKSYLQANGVPDVRIQDINIEAYVNWALTPARLSEALKKITRRFPALEALDELSYAESLEYNQLARCLARSRYPIDNIEKAKKIMWSEDEFYKVEKYMWASQVIEACLDLISAEFSPSQFTLWDYSMRYSECSSDAVFEALNDRDENMFLDYFENQVLPDLILEKPDLLGISLTYGAQVIPGLTLAKLVKQHLPETHVCIGGAILPNMEQSLQKDHRFHRIADSYVISEGEDALLKLVHALERGSEFSAVPNLIHLHATEIVTNKITYVHDLDSLPTPDYSTLPLELYLAPQTVFLLPLSRGCYWGKCNFCIVSEALDQRYRYRSRERIIDDLKALSTSGKKNYFFFADSSVSVSAMQKIATWIIESEIEIYWECEVRLEEKLTSDFCQFLFEGGCRNLIFGFESAAQRVLDMMDKGTTVSGQRKVLENCLSAGIGTNLQVFIGYPTETVREAQETISFLLENEHLISSIAFGRFRLKKRSELYLNYQKYGIDKLIDDSDQDMNPNNRYEISEGMSLAEAVNMETLANQKLSDLYSERDLGLGIDAHTLLLFSRHGQKALRNFRPLREDSPELRKRSSTDAVPRFPPDYSTVSIRNNYAEIERFVTNAKKNILHLRSVTQLTEREATDEANERFIADSGSTYILFYVASRNSITAVENHSHLEFLLNCIDGRRTIEEISRLCFERYKTDPAETLKECCNFINWLCGEGILELLPFQEVTRKAGSEHLHQWQNQRLPA